MKKATIILSMALMAATQVFAQTPVTVCEQTIKIGGTGEENMYFGFAAGDQINFEFESDKELKEIQIFELIGKNSSQKYSNFKATSAKTSIYVPEKAVYQFRFKNGAVGGRICKVKIQRVPESEATQRFNTTPRIKTLYDTTYTHYTEDSLVGYKTIYYQEWVRECVRDTIVTKFLYDEPTIVHAKMSDKGQYKTYYIDIPKNNETEYINETIISWEIVAAFGEDAMKQVAEQSQKLTSAVSKIPLIGQTQTAQAANAAAGLFNAIVATTNDHLEFKLKEYTSEGYRYVYSTDFDGVLKYFARPDQLQGKYQVTFFNDNIMDALDMYFLCYYLKEIKEYKDVVYDRERQEAQYVPVNRTRMNVTKTQVYVPAE